MNQKFLFCAMITVLLASGLSFATESMRPSSQVSVGDYYQVMFDGEGEANVLAKFVKMNTGNKSVDEIVFEIPGNNVAIKYVFQEVQTKTCNQECVRYESKCANYEKVCTNWDAARSTCLSWQDRCSNYQQSCAEWAERCYTDWQGTYVPLSRSSEQLSESVKYAVKLNQSIAPGESGSVLVFYKVMGYAGRLANWGFDFETAKSPDDIEYVRIAVSVDSDLYLRGGGTSVDYKNNFMGFESAAKSSAPSEAVSGEYAQKIRGYSQNVQYASGYVKEKSNLDPWESFHVTGVYVESGMWFLTYWKDAVIVLFVFTILKVSLWGRVKDLFRFGGEKFVKEKGGEGRFARIAAVGFVSAVSVLILWWMVFSFLESFMRSYYGPFSALLALLGGVMVILVLVAPAIYMGSRFGIADGVMTLAATIFWAFLILFVVMLLFGGPRYYALSYLTEAVTRVTSQQVIAD